MLAGAAGWLGLSALVADRLTARARPPFPEPAPAVDWGPVAEARLTTADGERPIPTEQENAELIAPEFVEAVRDGREPFVPGWSVLPAMRVLHRVQEQWDATHGKQLIPGRPVV